MNAAERQVVDISRLAQPSNPQICGGFVIRVFETDFANSQQKYFPSQLEACTVENIEIATRNNRREK